MKTYRIRIEGVNFGAFVVDTQDLNTIRGAGLALLRAPGWLNKAFKDLQPISLGASSGLYEISLEEQPTASGRRPIDDLCYRIRTFLAEYRHPYSAVREDESPHGPHRAFPLGLATFVVDAVEVGAGGGEGSFQEDCEKLLALNRFRQLQSPTLHLEAEDSGSVVGVCELDRLRPARQGRFKDRGAEPGEPLSEATWQRRDFGRAQKQDFYQQETGDDFPMNFCQSFEELTDSPGRGNLNAKMAVIYIDGNHFGKLQAEVCKSPELQQQFDTFLRQRRRAALKEILLCARDHDPGFRESAGQDPKEEVGEGPIRFETLLWGGDDLLWVVPAWRGLQVLAQYFHNLEAWRLPDDFTTAPGRLLTQAAGLVFCHRGAPIARIRRLADDLAREAKADRGRNLVAYQILESFDHTGDDLEAFRRRRRPPGSGAEALLLDGASLGQALALAAPVKEGVPHRKVLELARQLLAAGTGGAFEALEKRVTGDLEPATRESLDALLALLAKTEPKLGWLHLAELWDYLADPPAADAGGLS